MAEPERPLDRKQTWEQVQRLRGWVEAQLAAIEKPPTDQTGVG
jgi:hypothetical protein